MSNRIAGNRVLIAGSVDDCIDVLILQEIHDVLRLLTTKILQNGGGLILSAGNNPVHKKDSTLAIIFDWTIINAIVHYCTAFKIEWPIDKGKPIILIVYPNWEEKIPEDKKEICKRLLETGYIELKTAPIGVGGELRELQCLVSDILISVGGEKGVSHLARLFMSNAKPIIPLNFPTKSSIRNTSEHLYKEALVDTKKFLRTDPLEQATVQLKSISLYNDFSTNFNSGDYVEKIFALLSIISRPVAFYVRLMDDKNPTLPEVEWFFRKVIDPIIERFGFQKHEVSTDPSTSPLLNMEIYNEIKFASLVIADLTELRPNCFWELGFALGLGKRCILTAKKGTPQQFDVQALPCFSWYVEKKPQNYRKKFEEFFKKSMKRKSLVEIL